MAASLRLVGDIGGTNARFALAEGGASRGGQPTLHQPKSFTEADFPRIEDAIDHYLKETGLSRPPEAVIAFAGPVVHGAANSTNGVWKISEDSLEGHGFSQARVINDYAALVYAAPLLTAADLALIGPDIEGDPKVTVAVLGAGTGFGVGALARDGHSRTPVVTEGGHIAFAPVDEIEDQVLSLLRTRYGRVSVERILSGPGITDLYWALGKIAGRDVEAKPANEIVAAAGSDGLCGQTLERFCAIYGSVAGDLALVYGALGGVYLGGGIAPRILGALNSGLFRERFEAKGRFTEYLRAIPTRVITHPFAALLGASAALDNE